MYRGPRQGWAQRLSCQCSHAARFGDLRLRMKGASRNIQAKGEKSGSKKEGNDNQGVQRYS